MSVINCYKENNPLIKKKLREVSVEEGMEVATKLFEILNERKDGIGLAANQVGIDANVAVVNVREPIILINPVIEDQWDEIDYYEGCLSYPNQGIKTKRYRLTKWGINGELGYELYDHDHDKNELINLADNKDYNDVLDSLKIVIESYK